MSLDPNERRIQNEVDHHLEALQEQLEEAGMSPDQARAEALRRFGDPARIQAETRSVSPGSGLRTGLRGDLAQASRGLRRAPAFTLSVVATLALALGVTATVFGVTWDTLVRPLDVRSPETLVVLTEHQVEQGITGSPTSAATLQDWRQDLTTASDIGGWFMSSRTVEDPDRPEEVYSVELSGNLLPILGIDAVIGRTLTPDDEVDGAPATTMMISHDFWLRRFDGDPTVVGRTLQVDGTRREIVGVAPPRMDVLGTQAELLLPNALVPQDATNRGVRSVAAVARLAPGATLAAATTEVASLTEQIAATYPTSARGWSAGAQPLRDWVLGDTQPRLVTALAAVGLLLLVAAVNATNLMYVRAADGRREMAVRAALGAGRGALVRLRVTESVLLAGMGGVAGLGLVWVARNWFSGLEQTLVPRAVDGGLPASSIVGLGVLTLLTGLAVGLVPAVRGAESALTSVARGSAGAVPRLRGRNALLVVQLALTVVLLVGTGLLVRTARALSQVDLGFDPAGLVAARIALDGSRYPSGTEQRVYYDRLLEEVRALPGVRSAGLTSALPMDPIAANFDLPTRANPGTSWGEAPQADFRIVGDQVLETMGVRLLDGRLLEPSDRGGPMVAVVNRSLAELFWPGERAVGKQIQSVWRQDAFSEVIGVIEDTRFYGPREGSRPELYRSIYDVSWGFMTLVVRTDRDPVAVQAEIEGIVIGLDPLLPPQDVFSVASLGAAAIANERLYALLLTAFSAAALLLAAAGVYGVIAYTVRIQSREMGVRMALGASRESVVGGVVLRGIGLAVVGVSLGLLVATPATRMVSGLLFGVEPLDPSTLSVVAGLLVVVAATACALPALKAGRLDPVRILRDE